MSLYPRAIWKPVGNHSGVMSAHLGFVTHVQVGSGSCYAEFNNPGSQASSTWQIMKAPIPGDPLGRGVYQFVDADYIAWTEMAGNPYYDSGETEGLPSEPLTDFQCQELAEIWSWGHGYYGWPLVLVDHGERGITTHAHYPSGQPDPAWGNHPCPGSIRSAQLPGILSVAIKIASPAPAPTPPPPQPKPAQEEVLKSAEFNNQLHVFDIDPTGNLVHHWQAADKIGWGVETIGVGLATPQQPAVDAVHNGNLNVVARKTDGTVWHYWQSAGSKWGSEKI